MTAQEVEAGTWVDVTTDEELKENLRSNPKIQFDGERYSYKVGCWFGGWERGRVGRQADRQARKQAGRQEGRQADR